MLEGTSKQHESIFSKGRSQLHNLQDKLVHVSQLPTAWKEKKQELTPASFNKLSLYDDDSLILRFDAAAVATAAVLEHLLGVPEIIENLHMTKPESDEMEEIHKWSLILPTSSRTPRIIYIPQVGARYTSVVKITNAHPFPLWEIGTGATGGLALLPLGNIAILWKPPLVLMNWEIASDLQCLVDTLYKEFQPEDCVSKGLLFMASRNKDKRAIIDHIRIGRGAGRMKGVQVQTIASSASSSAAVGVAIQPTIGFLNKSFRNPERSEDNYGRYTVANTRAMALSLVVSPLDNSGLIGMTQTLGVWFYGVFILHKAYCNFRLPARMEDDDMVKRLSVNQAPSWSDIPLAVRYTEEVEGAQPVGIRLRLILVDRGVIGPYETQDIARTIARGTLNEHPAIPKGQTMLEEAKFLYGYARDTDHLPVAIPLPGLTNAEVNLWIVRTGKVRIFLRSR